MCRHQAYSITSSARPSSAGGSVRANVFAVLREDKDERNSQFGGGVPQDLPNRTFPSAPHSQKYRLGHRRNGFFQYLQPLPPDLDPGIERDAGEVAAGAVEATDQSRLQ